MGYEELVGKLVDNEINFDADSFYPYPVGFGRGTFALEEVTPGKAVLCGSLESCNCESKWLFDGGKRSLQGVKYTAKKVSRPWWQKLFCRGQELADFTELLTEFNNSPKKQMHTELTGYSCKLVLTWGEE